MGKSKDDKSRKRSSPASLLDEDGARKKRRRSKDEDKKRKSKKSRDSSEASKHRSDKDEKPSKKSKDKNHKHDDHSILKFKELSNDDYFSKNNEFATWLKHERKLYFSDLSSDSARALFSEFVAKWNKRELDTRYYDGIEIGPRSSHKWHIKQ